MEINYTQDKIPASNHLVFNSPENTKENYAYTFNPYTGIYLYSNTSRQTRDFSSNTQTDRQTQTRYVFQHK